MSARFLDPFEALYARLAENPLQFPIVDGQTRRAGFRGFPHGLFFRVGDDQVEIFACFHASRDPKRWRRRAWKFGTRPSKPAIGPAASPTPPPPIDVLITPAVALRHVL